MKQIEKLEFALNVFCKRILPAYFFAKNPAEFLKWQGNICKQAALLSVPVIKHFIGDEYTVEAYEGFFESPLGQYNHCWNYLVNNDDKTKNIICDFTSTINYFEYCTENDPTLHLHSNEMQVVKPNKISLFSVDKIDIAEQMSQNEYFTGQSSNEIIDETTNLLKLAKLW